MRKAVQAATRRGRKSKNDESGGPPYNVNQSNGPTIMVGGNNGEGVARRKATPEEAALTAKNYRLAKELSDLRVRHREETKNVNRLTMENMNLASRCREAISHVAMLKKELIAYQRKTAEVLAAHKQSVANARASQEKPNSTTSTPKSPHIEPRRVSLSPSHQPIPALSKNASARALEMAKEMEEMDRTLMAPPKRQKPPRAPSEESFTMENEEVEEDAYPMENNETSLRPMRSPEKEEPNGIKNGVMTASPHSYFPQTASPKIGKGGNYNEEFPVNLPSIPRINVRQRIAKLGGFAEMEDETTTSTTSGESNPNRLRSFGSKTDKSTISSIDAFEASFNTDFPDSFSSKDGSNYYKNGLSSTQDEKKTDIYNPFASSPPSIRQESTVNAEKRHRDPPGKNRTSPTPKVYHGSVQTVKATDAFAPPLSARERAQRMASTSPTFPLVRQGAPSSPPSDAIRSGVRQDSDVYSTPPASTQVPDTQEPRRPQKQGFDSARARFEKALQPKQSANGQGDSTSNEGAPENGEPLDDSDPSQPVSVKDRVSMFSGRVPLSPEKEDARIKNSISSPRRSTADRTFVDAGDIPMVSSIRRQEKQPPAPLFSATRRQSWEENQSPQLMGPPGDIAVDPFKADCPDPSPGRQNGSYHRRQQVQVPFTEGS